MAKGDKQIQSQSQTQSSQTDPWAPTQPLLQSLIASYSGLNTGETENPHDDADYSPILIRQKVFEAAPMTLDDALYNMEAVGHDFYLYIDAESGRPSFL